MDMDKVSIKDVARHAGVGLGTVSRAINNIGSVAPATKRKIMQSIEALGYTPNRLAQSMRSQKYHNIAFFTDLSNFTFSRVAHGIHQALELSGYTLTLGNIGRDNALDKVARFLGGRSFDGLIIATPREDDEELNAYLRKLPIPVVSYEQMIPGIANGIHTEYRQAVNLAVQHLLALGHERILLMVGSPNARPTRNMLKGYLEAHQKQGLQIDPSLIVQGDSGQDPAVMADVIARIQDGRITAVLCMQTNALHHLLRALKAGGMWYPDDVSVIAIEDDDLTQLLNPSMSVIKRPLFEMGKQVAEMLLRCIEQPQHHGELPQSRLETELVLRDSCSPRQPKGAHLDGK